MFDLTGRVALVTGGSRGIGRAVALRLAGVNARVAVCARSVDAVASVAEEIAAEGREAMPVRMDVADLDSVRAGFAEVRERFGPPDILVNNAGIAKSALIWRTDDELWNATMATNVSGTFYCMREALPAMIERGWGRVVNMASTAGKIGAPYIAAYSASKHAMIGLTRSAALEVATRGVTINAVCPGYVDTAMTDASVSIIVEKTKASADDARRRLEALSPQNRLMTDDEVAYVTLMLMSDDARGINGQAINLDGGGVTC